jgi:hypothetical protein
VKKRWIILIVLVLLLALGWYSFFVPHGGPRRAVASFKEHLRMHGEMLDFGSLQSASRAGTNVATQFLALRAAWIHPGDIYLWSMRQIAPGRAAVGHTNLTDFLMASYPTNKEFAAQLRDLLRGGKLDFNLDYKQGTSLLLPQLVELKSATMSLAETALQALHENDLAEAALDVNASVDLMRAWGDEPLLISCLVRLACVRISIAVGWEALQHNGWTDAQLAGLQTNWERLDLIESLGLVFSGERAFAVSGAAQARGLNNGDELDGGTAPKFGDWIGSLMAEPKTTLRETYDRYPKFWRWKNYWSYAEEYCSLQLATAAVDASRELATNRVFVPVYSALERTSSNIFAGFTAMTNHFVFLNGKNVFGSDYSVTELYKSTLRKVAVTETTRRLLITAVALKRFQMRHGVLPEKLDQLTPDFLESIPLDFMDGKPLRYKRRPGTDYLLYSVGADGTDDGGSSLTHEKQPPLPLQPGTTFDFTKGIDIVWPQAATEQDIKNYEARTAKRTNAPPVAPPTNP